MGCFLGCFGDAKDRRSPKPRIQRPDSQVQTELSDDSLPQQRRVISLQQQSLSLADQSIAETPPPNLVSELRNRPEGVEQLSPSLSPRKRVTFSSTITTYEHRSIYESADSLPEGNPNVQEEKERNPESSTQQQSEDEKSVKSSGVSYPSNHRYHNSRDSDDEAEDYSDSDLDDEDDYEDEDDIGRTLDGRDMWSVSTLTPSVESRTEENQSASITEKSRLLDEHETLRSKLEARNRSDYVNSVLTPVENVTQWKAVKSEGRFLLKSQKENNQSLYALPVSCDRFKNSNEDISVDASLSNWLVSSESILHKKPSSTLMS